MILIVDGITYLVESNMQRPIINCREMTAAEWNAPSALAERQMVAAARRRRQIDLSAMADLAPRKVGVATRIVRWLNEEVTL